jgi:hypothetical protein
MARFKWDQTGEKRYETGVDHGALYLANNEGVYDTGVPWNGLTTVTESPSGAETTKTYADNIPYVSLKSAEEFGATIEALYYPDEFAQCDGSAEPEPGVYIGQQTRRSFGFSYRTLIGNDTQGTDLGYKIHLVYGCDAAPSERANATVNDSPEAAAFSWEITTTPTSVGVINGVEYKPTSHLVVDSTKVSAEALATLEGLLYGTDEGGDAQLPTPAQVIALFTGEGPAAVDLGTFANQPSYNSATHVVTLPDVTGVTWRVNGDVAEPGAQPPLAVGETAVVTAEAEDGYRVEGDDDWTFDY